MSWTSTITPSRKPFAVTPADDTELPLQIKGLYIGNGGDVVLIGAGSVTPVTYKNVPTGAFIAVDASHVLATGTTATDIVGEA